MTSFAIGLTTCSCAECAYANAGRRVRLRGLPAIGTRSSSCIRASSVVDLSSATITRRVEVRDAAVTWYGVHREGSVGSSKV
jgi:hypothetical protein